MSSPNKGKGFKPKPNLEDFISGSATESIEKAITPAPAPVIEQPGAEVNQPNEVAPVTTAAASVKTKPAAKPASKKTASDDDEKEDSGKHPHIFMLNDEDHNAFRRYAFEKDKTKTSIMRLALRAYMKNNP